MIGCKSYWFPQECGMRKSLRLLLPVVALLFVAAGKKQPELTVRFFAEANPKDTDTFATAVQLQYPPRKAFVQKIPVISERDVLAIYPFQASDGTMGCAFKLDNHGRIAIDSLSIEKRGSSLVAVVNERQVIDMLIDKRVSDGIITIPRGLTVQEAMMIQEKFNTIGQPDRRK
jgi:hypothetical protein